MPLVVPGITSQGGQDLEQEWAQKVMGKKIGEQSNENTFAKTDLPKEHRVIKEGDMATMDFKENRLNLHTDSEGVVKKVTKG